MVSDADQAVACQNMVTSRDRSSKHHDCSGTSNSEHTMQLWCDWREYSNVDASGENISLIRLYGNVQKHTFLIMTAILLSARLIEKQS